MLRSRLALLTVLLSLLLQACGGSSSTSPALAPSLTAEEEPLVGFWHAPAYGKILEVVDEKNSLNTIWHYVTSDQCLTSDFEEEPPITPANTRLNSSGDSFELMSSSSLIVPGVIYSRIDELPDACVNQPLATKGDVDYQFNAETDLLFFWNSFNEFYHNFELSGTNWVAELVDAQVRLPDINSEKALFDLFADMVTPLHDAHNAILLGPLEQGLGAALNSENSESFSLRKADITEVFSEEYITDNNLQKPFSSEELTAINDYVETSMIELQSITDSYADDINNIVSTGHGKVRWFNTANNIGYISISSMSELDANDGRPDADIAAAEIIIDEALAALADTKGLVIDVRLNDGGSDAVSMVFASRFLDIERHLYSKQARLGNGRTPLVDILVTPGGQTQYLKPIVVLTSSSTVSAGEVFVLALRNRPQVSLIGEASDGSLSDFLIRRVTANIAFGMSNEFYLSPAGEWFEGVGIPVDIEIPFATKAQRNELKDAGLEQALLTLE